MSDNEQSKIIFKKVSRKNLRSKKITDDDSENEETISTIKEKLEETKMLQKLRQRTNGVNAICLALGEKVSEEILKVTDDPFSVKTDGVVSMTALKNAKLKTEDSYDSGIGTQFNAETNKRDEDEEMLKYIEEELIKRKNKKVQNDSDDNNKKNKVYCSPEEAALLAVPDHLKQSSAHRNEEMLSNQMLSGIPEVDLGIEAKIKNIEATEEAKLKLLWDRHRKKDGPSQFVPTNMAVNFVQHNRFNIDESENQKNKQEGNQKNTNLPKPTDKRKNTDEKATDDYHYERFKKQFRRY